MGPRACLIGAPKVAKPQSALAIPGGPVGLDADRDFGPTDCLDARVRFGGSRGEEIEVAAGDVAVLPAGTGHQRAEQSVDLVVIGAYPPAGTYNLCRGTPREHGRALAAIPQVPLPAADPVFGPQGPLTRLWRA